MPPVKKPAAAKKTIKKPATKSKKAPVAKDKAMLFAPAAGSDLDLKVRVKAVCAVLEDAPVSEAKAKAALTILQGVLELM